MNINIVLVVVLYNDFPKEYIFEDIGVRKIIVDNTPQRSLDYEGEDITYIALGDNYGIAKALNVGFSKAKELGADWVLTMDQDSFLPSNMISEYEEFIKRAHPSVGIVSPLLKMYIGEEKKASDSFEEINEALTSGSLISMCAFESSGGFKEELFIDGVDFEFCWNIKTKGYRVFRLNKVVMQHHLGNTQEIKLFGRHLFYVTHHNYIRRYYITRNSRYIRWLYQDIMPYPKMNPIRPYITLFKIIFFEKDVLRKLKAYRLGVKDFKEHKFGKFEYVI